MNNSCNLQIMLLFPGSVSQNIFISNAKRFVVVLKILNFEREPTLNTFKIYYLRVIKNVNI